LRELLNYNEIFLKLYYEVLSSVFTVVIIMKNKTEKRPFSKYPSSLTDNRAFTILQIQRSIRILKEFETT